MDAEDKLHPHLYARTPIDPNGEDSLAKIARQIAPGTKVLDVGCAVGELGRYLTEKKQCLVDGIEINPQAAAIARAFYQQVWELDVETTDLTFVIMSYRYHYIV
jgi:cyclopropane fatty-acyl-phospholipid synthase-like methyltransferase